MKFAIVLLSCLSAISCIQQGSQGMRGGMQGNQGGLAEGFIWGRQEDSTRRNECQYVSELSMISCLRGLVECETVAHFEELSQNYEIFGIGSTDMQKFHLYPRMLSDSVYGDWKQMTTSGQMVELNFYATGEQPLTTSRGLMVKDAQCFKRIIDLIKAIDNQVSVELVNKQRVTLVGYIHSLSGETLRVQKEQNNGTLPFGRSLGKMLDLDIGRKFDRMDVDSVVAGNPLLAPVSAPVWGTLEDTNRRFECQYSADLLTLSCFRGLVKCETVPRLDDLAKTYEIFGLGSTDMTTFHLYPRNYADTTFSDCRVPLTTGKTVELNLCRSGVECTGLMVKDSLCYQKIVDVLKTITEPVMVDVNGDNTNAKVSMMGYIINV